MGLQQIPTLSGQLAIIEQVRQKLRIGNNFILLAGDRVSGRTVLAEKLISAIEDDIDKIAFIPLKDFSNISEARIALVSQLGIVNSSEFKKSLKNLGDKLDTENNSYLIVVDDIETFKYGFLPEIANLYIGLKNNTKIAVLITTLNDSNLKNNECFDDLGISPFLFQVPAITSDDAKLIINYANQLSGQTIGEAELNALTAQNYRGKLSEVLSAVQQVVNRGSKMSSESKNQVSTKENKKNTLIIGLSICVVVLAILIAYLAYAYIAAVKENPSEFSSFTNNNKDEFGYKIDNKVAEVADDLVNNPVVVDGKEQSANAKEIVIDDSSLKDLDALLNEDTVEQNIVTTETTNNEKNVNNNQNKVVNNQNNDNKLDKTKSNVVNQKNKSLNNAPAQTTVATATDEAITDTNVVVASDEKNTTIASTITDTKKSNSKEVKTSKDFDNEVVANDDLNNENKDVAHNSLVTTDFNSLAGKNYVVQIIANNKKANVEKQVAMLSSKFNTWVLYRAKQKDYIGLIGDFKNQNDAKKAIESLPTSIRKNGPWAKSVSAVRKELK